MPLLFSHLWDDYIGHKHPEEKKKKNKLRRADLFIYFSFYSVLLEIYNRLSIAAFKMKDIY